MPGARGPSKKKQKPAALVLIVDDIADNRDLYAEYLTFFGFRVKVATNGKEAIAIARKHEPAVIVMDMSLPLMDGWEATRLLKADPATKKICIIALTGHAEPRSEERCAEAGCDYFVAKPCLPGDLANLIRTYLAQRQKEA